MLEEGHLSNLVEYVNVLDVNYKVKDLWTNEAWDFSKLATYIPEAIRYCIMASPIPLLPGVVDEVIWAATMTVVYSTKSAYLWLLNRDGHVRSDLNWSWLWKLNASEKCKMKFG